LQAFSLIREQPWYRRCAFERGLKELGIPVENRHPVKPDKNTLLLIWNRYATNHAIAEQVERAGGTVIVAENGYLGAGGTSPKFDVHPAGPQPHHYYALSLDWHNGRGRFNHGGPERFAALGVELKPWRAGGDYVLVCPNRSFGVGQQVMHPDWAERVAAKLRKIGEKVVVRGHPGSKQPKRPLAEDLAGASEVWIWSSSVGVHALVEGIPVNCLAPYWICKGAGYGLADGARKLELERMAWAQWTLAEIESGAAFRHLLSTPR
jgi:hypothetical protein